MKAQDDIYAELRNLYSGKTKFGGLRIGAEIEKLVNSLMQDVVEPFTLKSNVKYGKHEFDGEVYLGKGILILFDIHPGRLFEFRFDSLLNIARNTYFPRRKTYLLSIARSFSDQDKKIIRKITRKVLTDRVKLCFIDHGVLISLHQFTSKTQIDESEKVRRTRKRLFLSRLFDYACEHRSIVTEKHFEKAKSYADDRYPFEILEPGIAYMPRARAGFFQQRLASYEERLNNLEKILLNALDEIRNLKKETRDI